MTDGEKLQWLMDREQIKETIYRYPVGIDTHDLKLFRSIFTDKIDILLSVASRADRPRQIVSADSFTRSADRLIAQVFAVTQHSLTNYEIDVRGDDATSLCYMQARHFPPKDRPTQPIWDVGGYYNFHLKRTAEGWKIAKYTLIITWETNRPPDLKMDL
jgi:hypothetical protein